MAGGPEDAYERMRPVLEALGGQVRRVGGAGAGQVAKACNQLLVAQTMGGGGRRRSCWRRPAARTPAAVREALLGGFRLQPHLEATAGACSPTDYRAGLQGGAAPERSEDRRDEARGAGLALPGAARAARLMAALRGRRRRTGFRGHR